MRRAAIITAVRTPVGRYGGALAPVRADDLAAGYFAAFALLIGWKIFG